MDGIAFIGPRPRPDVAYRVARDRAEREQRAARLELRAADQPEPCPYCSRPDLYPQTPPGGCPACTPPPLQHNGYDVLASRSNPPRIEYGPPGTILSVR